MNRAKANHVVQQTLFPALSLLLATSAVHAQLQHNPFAIGTGSGSGARTRTSKINQRQFYGPNLTQVPKSATQGQYRHGAKSRAPGDAAVIRQTVLISKQNPSQQFSSLSAPSQDEHLFATSDEKYLYFDSDRADDSTVPQTSTGKFNLFRSFIDGSGVTQITTGTDNKIEPAVSQSGERIAYVSGGTYANFSANLDNPRTSAFQLFYINIQTGGAAVSLTQGNASGFAFSDVRHPTWSSGGDKIAFAAKRDTDPANYHIFIEDVQSTQITQVTSGPSNDYSPSWSPDSRLIAFTSNAGGFSTGGSPVIGTSTVSNDDIFVTGVNTSFLRPAKVTNFTVTGKGSASNKNPAWSTLRPDPLDLVTAVDENGSFLRPPSLLAFASNRADTNHDGVANDLVPTFDIYWLKAIIKPDANNSGSYTVTTPESQLPDGNHALKLRTSTPDTAIDPNDPTAMFDPNFATNEDYPTWPQYISSYRIFYQSDRGVGPTAGTQLNTWGSTIFDVNAPTLLKYNIADNEIVHLGRDDANGGSPATASISQRQFNSGDTIRIKTRIVDYESGVGSVFVQFKVPNSSPKSADNTEHKIYYPSRAAMDTSATVLQVPFEMDSQAINPATYAFRSIAGTTNTTSVPPQYRSQVGLPQGWPGWNLYIPGFDDQNALTGGSNPPDNIAGGTDQFKSQGPFWLQLYDDGPKSLGGHEPEGEVAGDGVYTNIWTTPQALPTDFYMDIIVRDTAIDPFFPNETVNWKIYDNVWGLSTESFVTTGGFLYVNDYACGQRFFSTNFGTGSNFNIFSFDAFSKNYSGVPVESWMTELDPSLQPTQYQNGTNIYPVINVLTALGKFGYGSTDASTQDGSDIAVTDKYDIWRILARGPVPDSVLQTYGGHIETQPADILAGSTTPRQTTVAERAVIWHAPYAGDLFVGPGSIVDTDTQTRLTKFVNNGGRIFMCGEDLAFGLSLGQTGNVNPFLSTVLHVNFTGDWAGDWIINLVAGYGIHPISTDYFYTIIGGHNYPNPPAIEDPPSTGPIYLRTPIAGMPPRSYSAHNQVSNDRVTFTAAQVVDVAGLDGTFGGSGTGDAVMWYTNTANAPYKSKVVFSPFGWEGITPEYYLAGTTMVLKNRRTEMLHNVGDYLRTGRIIGSIRDVNGATPLNRVFVRAVSQDPNVPANQRTVATAYSQADGSYTLNGLDANGLYAVDAVLPGFLTQHGTATFFHGGWRSRLDLFLTKAQPGNIRGLVTTAATGTPVPGVIVVATSKATGDIFTGVTDASGNYIIKNLLSQDSYIVRTPLDTPGNIASLGFGGSIPPSYGGGEPGALPIVVVTDATDVLGIDFKLKQAPGRILGTVTDIDSGLPIAGATVTATGTGATNPAPATTAADGTYTITGADPGTYLVTASASGYAVNSPGLSVVVNSNADTLNANIKLKTVPPGSLSGLVMTTGGLPVSGATVTVTTLNDAPIQTTTTGSVTTVGNYAYNYRFSSLPAGAKVKVSASRAGFTTKTGVQTVGPVNSTPPGPEVQGVNFVLDPLHAFSSQLTLVSAPQEYSGVSNGNVGDLFGIPSADRASKAFNFISWDTDASKYIYYPTPPADTFHLGKGYFMSDSNPAATLNLTNPGADAPKNVDGSYKQFAIPLKTGWNLIGDPFTLSLNFLTLKIQEADGSQKDVQVAQSGATPSIGAALWTFENGNYAVVFTLDAYRGYWIRAFRPVTLLVDPASAQGRAASQMRTVLEGNANGAGWKLQLNAEAGTTRSAPGILGVNSAATNGYDTYKLESPPVVSSQSVNLSFEHPEWAGRAGKYSVDVRSNAGTLHKWDFTVNSTVDGEPVTLSWPNLANVPGKNDIFLTDLDAQTTMNLRTRNGYTIPATRSTGPITRHFTLEVKRATRPKLELNDVVARVNGSADGRAATSADIHFSLSADATVEVSINQNGRKVRSVEAGRTRAAGSSQTVWDLRDDKGALVPASSYTVEIRAKDSSGYVTRKVTPILITR